MSELGRIPEASMATLSASAQEILFHLCESDCRTFGNVTEWCEARGDCTYAVRCPGCATQFVIAEDDLAELEAWTKRHGDVLVCGVRSAA